jgi:predicted  nucleic acid-binding Zn-ribbon protein
MNSDETIRAQCQAREDYYWMERSRKREYERVLSELDVANSKLDVANSKVSRLASENDTLHSENDTLHSQNDTLHSELDAANSKVTDLMQYIAEQGIPLPEDK